VTFKANIQTQEWHSIQEDIVVNTP